MMLKISTWSYFRFRMKEKVKVNILEIVPLRELKNQKIWNAHRITRFYSGTK